MAVYTYRERGELVRVAVTSLVEAFAMAIDQLRAHQGDESATPVSIAVDGVEFDQRAIFRVCRRGL